MSDLELSYNSPNHPANAPEQLRKMRLPALNVLRTRGLILDAIEDKITSSQGISVLSATGDLLGYFAYRVRQNDMLIATEENSLQDLGDLREQLGPLGDYIVNVIILRRSVRCDDLEPFFRACAGRKADLMFVFAMTVDDDFTKECREKRQR